MQYIPPFLSQIIDAVAFQGDPTEMREDWQNWKRDFEEYYQREGDYTLSEEDAQNTRNLPPLLEQLNARVEGAFAGQCPVDELVKCSIEFFEAHDSFFEEREKQYFVQNPALDRLLKASVAHLQGRCGAEAVLKRAPDAALAVNSIHDLYQSVREELPKELDQGSVEGFQRAQKAFEMLAECEDAIPTPLLEEAVFELRSAGELLEHLPNLFDRFEREVGSPIPILGPALNLLREEDTEDTFEHFQTQAWPAFAELWQGRQDGWMLNPVVAYELLGATEQELSNLAELLEVYPDQEDAFWDTVEHLEELFEQIQEHTMSVEELQSSPYWPETQLILNLLRGGAPLYAAHSLAGGIRESGGEAPEVIRSVGASLLAFVREPEPLPLLQALKELKVDFELSKTTRPCTNCGYRLPLDAKACQECGSEVEELSVSG